MSAGSEGHLFPLNQLLGVYILHLGSSQLVGRGGAGRLGSRGRVAFALFFNGFDFLVLFRLGKGKRRILLICCFRNLGRIV